MHVLHIRYSLALIVCTGGRCLSFFFSSSLPICTQHTHCQCAGYARAASVVLIAFSVDNFPSFTSLCSLGRCVRRSATSLIVCDVTHNECAIWGNINGTHNECETEMAREKINCNSRTAHTMAITATLVPFRCPSFVACNNKATPSTKSD